MAGMSMRRCGSSTADSEWLCAVKAAAEKFGADPGVWMSPWGGYSKPKQERIAFGKPRIRDRKQRYALSGPNYYAAFRDVCLEMVRKYGVNQFKFDGRQCEFCVQGSAFDSDFAAAIHLISELRAAEADLFINLTTGRGLRLSGCCMRIRSGAERTTT